MNYTVTLTQQEIQIVMLALGEIPLKLSGAVFSKIDSQAKEQTIHQDHSDKEM